MRRVSAVRRSVLSAACLTLMLTGLPFAVVAAPAENSVVKGYTLGPGDKLRVIVFDEQTLTGEYFVSDSGVVSLPLVGDIKAIGLTVDQFRDRAEAAFRNGYLTDPRLAVEVLNYRPFYILGEVNKPGEYPYTSALTVFNAVATAQGFTYRANTKVVFIRHLGDKSEHKERLDNATPIVPGDTIRIAERFF